MVYLDYWTISLHPVKSSDYGKQSRRKTPEGVIHARQTHGQREANGEAHRRVVS
jgi:hypothetical protein